MFENTWESDDEMKILLLQILLAIASLICLLEAIALWNLQTDATEKTDELKSIAVSPKVSYLNKPMSIRAKSAKNATPRIKIGNSRLIHTEEYKQRMAERAERRRSIKPRNSKGNRLKHMKRVLQMFRAFT